MNRISNPVLALELSRQYKNKAYVIGMTAVYAVVLYNNLAGILQHNPVGGMLYAFVVFDYTELRYSGLQTLQLDVFQLHDLAAVRMFQSMVSLVLGMIFLVVPVLSATSVVGRRQRETLMLVQLSLLRRFDIVWGTVVASIVPVLFPAWLCVVRVVLSSWNVRQLLFGIVGVLVFTVGAALVVAAVSILISTFTKNNAAAIVVSYGMAFLVCFVLWSIVHWRV